MTSSTTVFILLDAFRWDYVNPVDTPFLHAITESGVYARRLVSSSGFAQRTAIFCGTFPDRTGNFAMFTFDPTRSPFGFLAPYAPALAIVQRVADLGWRGGGRLRAALHRRCIEPRARKEAVYAPAAFIPLHVLHLIGIAEDEKPIHALGALPVESIFDLLHRRGSDYAYVMFPEVNCDDDHTLALVLQRLAERRSLYLVQFSDSDLLGHLQGPESAMRHKVAGEIDRKLRALKRAFEERFEDVTFFVIGDHGMMQVEETVDVAGLVHGRARQHGWRHGKDYLLFLDSTLARLWALDPRAEGRLADLLDNSLLDRTGARITESVATENRLPWGDRRYGDLIWWARPGVLIHPDYFHPRFQVVKGMHGYDSRHEKMHGFALLHGKRIRPASIAQARLVDICPTLCDVLGVPAPAQSEGKSLLASPLIDTGQTGTS
ncbi:MAG TPA: alkaline phosphatase family protein [Candidatus Methylomirabilis sp.]|nr:alkaline phosphatase family protein [Candidatus Methylomirabilis sp.]